VGALYELGTIRVGVTVHDVINRAALSGADAKVQQLIARVDLDSSTAEVVDVVIGNDPTRRARADAVAASFRVPRTYRVSASASPAAWLDVAADLVLGSNPGRAMTTTVPQQASLGAIIRIPGPFEVLGGVQQQQLEGTSQTAGTIGGALVTGPLRVQAFGGTQFTGGRQQAIAGAGVTVQF
jgi:hypothetical protein